MPRSTQCVPTHEPQLQAFLDSVVEEFHQPSYLGSDPLEFVHRFTDPWDREVVAFCSALLAYGNVKQIRRSVEDLLDRLSRLGGPAAAVRAAESGPKLARSLEGFVHRFNTGLDIRVLLVLIGKSWSVHGSVGRHFVASLSEGDTTIESGLNRFIADWRAWIKQDNLKGGKGLQYLLTAPESGSCCKRWCMLLRWMGRKDEVDPGLWVEGSALLAPWGRFPRVPGLRASQLIMPLDTHTGQISQMLGLTERKSLGWLAAREITERLAEFRPDDPCLYDFALARLGILDLCKKRYLAEICNRCSLLSVCRVARIGSRQGSGAGPKKGPRKKPAK